MSVKSRSPLKGPIGASLTALSIGAATIVSVNVLFTVITGAPLNLSEELPVLLFQAVWVTIPFFLLAMLRVENYRPWLIGVGLTVAFWSFYLFVGITSRGDGSGANIGLGLLILISPIPIAIASVVTARNYKN